MTKTYDLLRRRYVIALFALLLGSISAIGQDMVKGYVYSDQRDPLIGVNIILKGTDAGTVTDIDGAFELKASPGDTLVVSYIGFTQQEVPVTAGGGSLNITLLTETALLDEVVVVGYGSVKRSDLTGSVASLTGDKLNKIPFSSTAQALTGRLPGVNVLTTDGSPDAEVVIRVRGGGSITQDNSPLYVVDGYVVNGISNIPPSDIESISVLKDAAATAIYGSRASNGVIVITTKQPVAGKISVSYNAYLQIKALPDDRRYDVLSPYEFALANYEYAAIQSETALNNFERYFGVYDDLELYKQKKPTDWQEELFGDPQLSQYHNILMTGGTEMTKISLSLTNNTDEGLLIGSGYMRNNGNFKLSQTITKGLTFDAIARITQTIVDGNGTSGTAQINIKDAVQTRPVNGIADEIVLDLNTVDPNDDYAQFVRSLTTPTELIKQDWRKRTTNVYNFQASLAWDVLDNLQLKSTANIGRSYDENLRFYGPLTSFSFNNGGSQPLGVKTNQDRDRYRWLNTVSYKFKNLGEHSLNVIVGHEVYSEGGFDNLVGAAYFRPSITPEELFANLTFGTVYELSTQELTRTNRLSFFGRADYQLKGKYLLTATLRSDASSRFSKDNRVGYFPAVAVAWRISEEPFLSNSHLISDLKLRLSIGQTGNDRIDATATQFLFEGETNRGPGFGNYYNVFYTPSESTLYNPDLVWETTTNRNIGLDFGLWRGRLTGSLDLYKNTTKDLLLQSAIPSNTGFSTQWNNIGSTSNRGVELGLTGYIIEKPNFSLTGNFNIGVNRAKVEELDGTTERFFQSNWGSTDLRDQNDFYLRVGGTLGDIYGYVTDGYYTTDDFSEYIEATDTYVLKDGVPNSSSTVGNTNIRPGFLKLKDLNGDGLINSEDRQVIGNTLPKHQGGFGLDARYKGFDASIFFNWSYGNDIYNTGKIQYNQFRRITYGNLLTTMSLDNRFTYLDVDGSLTGEAGGIVTDLGQLAQLNAGKEMWSQVSFGVAQATIHSWAVEDGSFLRLNNLQIGYSLPPSWTRKVGLSQFRVYATGNNLKLWTKYSGYDPEVSTTRSSTYSGLTPGVDYSSFPRSRSYTFGINATF